MFVVRMKGGLGNQLFRYAAARRLALANDTELVIDHVSGFVRDRRYRRTYQLDHFRIPCRKATPAERLEPMGRLRRAILRSRSEGKPLDQRRYVKQQKLGFDERILALRMTGYRYLDGLWESERYFSDVADTIRRDLEIIPPADPENRRLADEIRGSLAVAVHLRWLHGHGDDSYRLSRAYYRRAVARMEARLGSPHYFVFSDSPESARAVLELPERRVTFVSHNRGDDLAYADLWLMAQCRHFVIANSTFSWWGAWLAGRPDPIVLAPEFRSRGEAAWGFEGLIPERWESL